MLKRSFIVSVVLVFATAEAESQETPAHLQFVHHPYVLGNVMMCPIGELARALQITIIWDAKTKSLTLQKELNAVVKLKLNEKTAIVCGTKTAVSQPMICAGNVLFVPARFVAENLGLKFSFSGDLLTIGDKTWKLDSRTKRFIIDKSRQRLYAYEGIKKVYETHTVTGRKGYSTPSGIFQIYKRWKGWHKVRGKRWSGWMYNALYFNADGDYAIHGSHQMPNYPASHGCCRLSVRKPKKGVLAPADWAFTWATNETGVWIFEKL